MIFGYVIIPVIIYNLSSYQFHLVSFSFISRTYTYWSRITFFYKSTIQFDDVGCIIVIFYIHNSSLKISPA